MVTTEEILKLLKEIAEERIPFNKVLGLTIQTMDEEHMQVKFDMRDELVGNFMRGNLHGGVISSVLDLVGGMNAWLGVMKQMKDRSLDDLVERFIKIGPIDLRIDYLRPGFGKYFISSGNIMRTGNRVSVVRMELENDQKQLIAVGTGTYIAVSYTHLTQPTILLV